MNTQLNIKTRLTQFSPTFVTLLLGVVVALFLGGPSIQAQTTATVDSSITIPVKGSVSDPNGTVTVSGSVIVTCRRVVDDTAATKTEIVMLDFDFSQLKGTSGSSRTTLSTYVTGDNHAEEIRPLLASDKIIVTSPYYDTAKGALSARSMLVTATLNFDVASGKLTSGSISVGNNVVTSSAVGSVSTTTIN
jgi:hypothetical protein